MEKFIKLKNNTVILLGKAKSKLLKNNPTIKATDDTTINTALKNYIGDKK